MQDKVDQQFTLKLKFLRFKKNPGVKISRLPSRDFQNSLKSIKLVCKQYPNLLSR